jgi:polar amino acid transport system substrate-binding protein
VDGTIITASTQSNEPVVTAGEATREKGRVVVVGAVGLDLPREPYYLKEIDFRIARSYGPGRYDSHHEEGGNDYPFGYVRFTEGRNIAAFLNLVADRRIDVDNLITDRFTVDQAPEAYRLLSADGGAPRLGILIHYPERTETKISIPAGVRKSAGSGIPAASFIGAGNYASGKLIPACEKRAEFELDMVCTATGRTAHAVHDRFKFRHIASSPEEVLSSSTEVVFIATRHSTHASLVLQALRSGKHTFVEKPLCIRREELEPLAHAFANSSSQLMVGFNRRFAPLTEAAIAFFRGSGITAVAIRINAGRLPSGHWSLSEGEGGRIVGEACHFVDLAAALTRSVPISVQAIPVLNGGHAPGNAETCAIQILMRNGAIASIVYAATGSSSLAKERVECHGGGRSAVIDDFRELALYDSGVKRQRSRVQDKGQAQMVAAFAQSIRTGVPAIPAGTIFAVSDCTIAAIESAASGRRIAVADYRALDGIPSQ